eukprot:TRINITY_DN10207_c0_g1_i1.p1 TRINITY_DN10207_c0_g1~~TRINITY_DN10207_c0_g1_i1.p1  ORF type:complete len:254 (+),score=37.65 TRINITY_DN10207_c0_g1_i1:295-1056(+)
MGECHGASGRPFQKRALPGFRGFLETHLPPLVELAKKHCNGKWWWVYSYQNWAELQGQFREHLRPKALDYARQHFPQTIPTDTRDTSHWVVHYRLGNEETGSIKPEVLMRGLEAALSSFKLTPPKNITLLAGAFHFWDTQENQSKQQEQRFIELVKQRWPGTSLTSVCGDADEDWFRMAFAPVLVVTHGSYSATAAATNEGYKVTLASPNLVYLRSIDYAYKYPAVPRQVSTSWVTYNFTIQDVIMAEHAKTG